MGITENKPKEVKTPYETIQVRARNIEHIINGGGDGHLPDKKRYKSINKMVLTLKNPTLIVETETEKKTYIKLFKTKTGSKNQVAIVYNDKNGDFIYTSMPVDKDKKYLLNRINNSTIIYKKGQSRVAKSNSAANNSIPNSNTDFKSDVIFNKTNPNIYYQEEINQKDDINKRTDKSKYLTDNEVAQLEKDKQNFETYISKLINGELSHRSQIRVLEHLPSAYNNIPELKGKKVVVTQDVYKKIIDLPNRFNKNHNIDRKRALKLPQFISDPLYILQSISEGNEHRFIVVTNSKGNKPSEKLSIILNPNNNVAVVSAYDEKINISEEKKNNRVLYDKKKELSKTILASEARAIDNSNNSVPNSDTDFKSNVKTLLQSNDDSNIADTNHRASIEFKDDETIISLAKSSDASSVMHEFAHLYLHDLKELAKVNKRAEEQCFNTDNIKTI